MTCTILPLSGGGFAIVCSRGRRSKPAPCSAHGCSKPHEFLCDYPLTGAKEGRTCSKRLCSGHRRSMSEGVDYCEAHHLRTIAESTSRPEEHQPPETMQIAIAFDCGS